MTADLVRPVKQIAATDTLPDPGTEYEPRGGGDAVLVMGTARHCETMQLTVFWLGEAGELHCGSLSAFWRRYRVAAAEPAVELPPGKHLEIKTIGSGA